MTGAATKPGRLIAVVGPSGVGKDSIMAGLAERAPEMSLVRRTITRAPELGGEDFDHMPKAAFEAAAQNGAFCLHWQAHGLHYGIPALIREDVAQGAWKLANLSRGVLAQAAQVFDDLVVLHITASPDVLAQRLAARGRESAEDIALRLSRADKPLPPGLNVVHLTNDGALEESIARAQSLLSNAKATPDAPAPSPSPQIMNQ